MEPLNLGWWYEPRHEKTGFLHMRKQRRWSTAQLISAFVFATWIMWSLSYLNLEFQASSRLLWLYSPVSVGPGRKPRRQVFSRLLSSTQRTIKELICLHGCPLLSEHSVFYENHPIKNETFLYCTVNLNLNARHKISCLPSMSFWLVKNLQKSSTPEPAGRFPRNLVCNIGDPCPSWFVQMMTLVWPWPI